MVSKGKDTICVVWMGKETAFGVLRGRILPVLNGRERHCLCGMDGKGYCLWDIEGKDTACGVRRVKDIVCVVWKGKDAFVEWKGKDTVCVVWMGKDTVFGVLRERILPVVYGEERILSVWYGWERMPLGY